jgi:Uncharacterized protein conserved in bacteria (DUF2188)
MHMAHITYQIVEHDGGWAYKADGSFSETFATHAAALAAAQKAAGEQRASGVTDGIVYQDAAGTLHEEVSEGDDRPDTSVVDKP